ncbi:MAG: hypothetical protein KVP17_001110 [Porospora cf. gigantea B]|uniref:uncharacterized protein n=1 Tax=Porospora cf. gigantea B TaxID=2853592 RepID=UPI003571CF0E|nr:MAG: hypothetical protein KVP17_001110 [Porospora cf. gigantea B]
MCSEEGGGLWTEDIRGWATLCVSGCPFFVPEALARRHSFSENPDLCIVFDLKNDLTDINASSFSISHEKTRPTNRSTIAIDRKCPLVVKSFLIRRAPGCLVLLSTRGLHGGLVEVREGVMQRGERVLEMR